MGKKLTKQEVITRILESRTGRTMPSKLLKAGKVRIDYMTAQCINAVLRDIPAEHYDKFIGLDWAQMASFAFKNVSYKIGE